jgi:hypothetical protein
VPAFAMNEASSIDIHTLPILKRGLISIII